VTEYYGVDADADLRKKAMVQVNWALPELTDNADLMAMGVLSYAMIGAQASPLRKALVDSGLGEDVTGGGFGAGLRQPTCSVGMKGIDLADAPRVEALIDATLAQLAETGFEADMLEAAVNSIEFNLRENNTGSTPRGLALYMRCLRPWLYGGDPIAPLAYEAPLAEVKRRLAAEPGYFQGLIRTYLLANSHRVTVTLAPSTTLNAERAAEETARLADAKAAMTSQEIEAVIANTSFLKAYQARTDSPEDLAKLPRLTLADLDRMNKPMTAASCFSTTSSPTALSTCVLASTCAPCPPTCCPTPNSLARRCWRWAPNAKITSSSHNASGARPAASVTARCSRRWVILPMASPGSL
jgi:Zn-dependent M16 (insulinase) family peptidase